MKASTLINAICFSGVLGACLATTVWGQVRPQLQQTHTEVFKVVPASLHALETPASKDAHPLYPLLKRAGRMGAMLRDNVEDYTCVLVKRERIDGELLPYEHLRVKFRGHRSEAEGVVSSGAPFGVYMKQLAPAAHRGREALYVDGENDGEMLVTKGGRRNPTLTFSIRANGRMACRDNRYPITAFGIENLLARISEVAELDMNYGECSVRILPDTRVDDRHCTLYEITHPVRRSHFRFHIARIFVDNELQVPIRYAAYSWPEKAGDPPVVEEEYTYRQLRFNVGLTDSDFDRNHPKYHFQYSLDES